MDTTPYNLTARQHGVLHQALTHYVKLLKEELTNTSDISYSWSLLAQQLEDTRKTAETLRLKVE